MKKWLLEEEKTGTKYIGYAYEIQREFENIKKEVTPEVSRYNSIREDGLTSLEEVFLTTWRKKKYLVFLRKHR